MEKGLYTKQQSKYFLTASYMDEALLYFLDKKDFEFITIKEICKKAGVNRSTFYLHYENLNDLLEETINYVGNKFKAKFDDIENNDDFTKTILTNSKYLKSYLTFIKENLKIYKLMHEKPHLFKIDYITKHLYENIFDIALSNHLVLEKEKKYIFAFYTDGVLGIIKKWIESNCDDDIDLVINIIEKNTFVNEKNHK
jgi:AcrR family transcriptional regulator